MTEKVQQIINDIQRKTSVLYHELTSERSKNEQLQAELNELSDRLEQGKQELLQRLSEIEALNLELETSKIQVVSEDSSFARRKDDDIDELVKEIEYCISQLKK